MVDEIDFIQSMQRLDIKDGDILVLKTKSILSEHAISNLKNSIELAINIIGFKVKCLVLEDDMDIGVLRKEKNAL